ncbi:MAG: VWA domain-containing protein [Candidatus Korobacteraceae bacterium]
MQAQRPVPAPIVQQAVSFVAGKNQGFGKSKLSAAFAGLGAPQLLFPLKLLRGVADNSFVQRSALITGLSLALSGVTLAGIGEWAGGRFDSSAVDPGSSSSAATAADYDVRNAAFLPPLPVLPESNNYLPASTPGYTFHHDVPEVRLQFTVADEQGRLVQNLSPADVRVLDDQSPVARFTDFERDDNLPLRLGIVLDTSDSVKRVLPDEKTAALNFLDRVMRPQIDNVFVMAFGGNVRVWQTPTANRQQLTDALRRMQQPGWGTRFFDALYAACSDQLSGHDDAKLVHRAIVVLSDGDDTDSLRGLAEVIAIAQRSEIQIYALTLHARRPMTRGDQILQRLADQTGGRFYIAPSSKDLDAAFAQIEQDLRAQYYVSFTPQARPGFHSLRVEVRTRQKLEIHARQGYYALAP